MDPLPETETVTYEDEPLSIAVPAGGTHRPETAPTSPGAAEPFTLTAAAPAYEVKDEDDGNPD